MMKMLFLYYESRLCVCDVCALYEDHMLLWYSWTARSMLRARRCARFAIFQVYIYREIIKDSTNAHIFRRNQNSVSRAQSTTWEGVLCVYGQTYRDATPTFSSLHTMTYLLRDRCVSDFCWCWRLGCGFRSVGFLHCSQPNDQSSFRLRAEHKCLVCSA